MTATNVTKYDSATIIPKGRLVGELVFGLGLGVGIDRRGKTKLAATPSQSVVPSKSLFHLDMSGYATHQELGVLGEPRSVRNHGAPRAAGSA